MSLQDYHSFYQHSIESPEDFWARQGKAIDWHTECEQVLDFSEPPYARWFVGGETNLCYNAVDRHLEERGDKDALIYVSTETGERRKYTYRELYDEVNAFAAALRDLGVRQGDRIVIYLPMIIEAVVAMLACVRLGAIHSFVFRDTAATDLAARIDDAKPKVVVTADAGMHAGNITPYGKLMKEALHAALLPPEYIVICNRGFGPGMVPITNRGLDYASLCERYAGEEIPVEWVESSHASYILHTSGTRGAPKIIQRDTGGHAVALVASMRHIFASEPGETIFTASAASDIGWVVGHSYIVYAPLLYGMTSVVYEGVPTYPNPGIWWKIIEEHGVNTMLTSPTAIRLLEEQGLEYPSRHDTNSLRNLFLAGEPLDEATSCWASEGLGVPVRNTYWQTETGWPVLSSMLPGLKDKRTKPGSVGLPVYGYDLRLVRKETGEEVTVGESGVLTIAPPLPPGCASVVRGEDESFVETYFSEFSDQCLYSTFDWAERDKEGEYFILGRSDDLVEVCGRRFGTRDLEEAITSHAKIREAAVVSVAGDKGQSILAYVVPKDRDRARFETYRSEFECDIKETVVSKLGAVARPNAVYFVSALPKTSSGKVLHRCIRALASQQDPGDLSTIKDPSALDEVQATKPDLGT